MIKLRPHHLLCLSDNYCQKGGWYNLELHKHANKTKSEITRNPNIRIKIVKKCDDICKKCPHKLNGICQKRPKINHWIIVMDNKVLRKLRLEENSIHKAQDIFNLTINKIKPKDLKNICRGCESLNYCLKYKLSKFYSK